MVYVGNTFCVFAFSFSLFVFPLEHMGTILFCVHFSQVYISACDVLNS